MYVCNMCVCAMHVSVRVGVGVDVGVLVRVHVRVHQKYVYTNVGMDWTRLIF